MVSDPTAAVFGHYNARSTAPEAVAARFVAPPQFWEIVTPGNTVLTGPRGSGKTTLLKMLQAPALEYWPDKEGAARARELATYSGVFVPADRSWSGQVSAVGGELPDQLRTDFGAACFTLHSLRALSACAAVRATPPECEHPHDRVALDRAAQEHIVRDIWRPWALDEPVGSFRGLQFALSELIGAIGNIARRSLRDRDAAKQLGEHPALDLDVVDAAVPFIERFNHAAEQEDHAWAFLVDEIEFLPPGIHQNILRSMRGRDPRIVQKVSLAPYTLISKELANPLGGWEGHDLRRVDLTFGEKEHGYPFSRQLVEQELAAARKRGRESVSADAEGQVATVEEEPAVSPEEFFGGPGFFEMPPGATAYGQGSRNREAIERLAIKDRSFREWLAKHEIDPESLAELDEVGRASTVRKAITVILLRDEYLHSVRGRLQFRSRKQPRTYIGELSAYALCENNPRLLMALTYKLLESRDELDDSARVEAVNQAASDYDLHLRAIEVPEFVGAVLLPRQLIRTIGDYFTSNLYAEDFDPEPPLSFEVGPKDFEIWPGLEPVLVQLAHYGAIVPISEMRFRLAHMFAPLFKLPLRKGRPHSLGTILGPSPAPPLSARTDAESQLRIRDQGAAE